MGWGWPCLRPPGSVLCPHSARLSGRPGLPQTAPCGMDGWHLGRAQGGAGWHDLSKESGGGGGVPCTPRLLARASAACPRATLWNHRLHSPWALLSSQCSCFSCSGGLLSELGCPCHPPTRGRWRKSSPGIPMRSRRTRDKALGSARGWRPLRPETAALTGLWPADAALRCGVSLWALAPAVSCSHFS